MAGKLDGKVALVTDASLIAYTVNQPDHVSVNEILIRPTNQEV